VQDDARRFADRDLSSVDYVYLWADGVHLNVRLDEEKLCLLVMIGVRVDGTKELVALADGYRESTGSWADLLRDCKRRGMRAPILAVGDGALGFWGALREVFPEARSNAAGSTRSATSCRRCPSQRTRREEGPRRDLERRGPRPRPPRRISVQTGLRRKFAKATAKITDDLDELLAFYDYRPNTGSTCARPTQSSRPSPPSVTAPR